LSLLHAIVLAIVQGVTEFLPVSSDGHLVLVPWLLGWDDQGLAFDAAVHLGTLGAVIVYFRREWIGLVRGLLTRAPVRFGDPNGEEGQTGAGRLVLLLAAASVPTAIIGFALKGTVEGPLRKPEWAGAFLVGTALVLLVGEVAGKRLRRMEHAGVKDAVAMGVAQGLAVFPGFSRSGSTIAVGLATGLTREAAARLSFLIAVPAIAGAGALLLTDLAWSDEPARAGPPEIAIGIAVSFVTGLLALGLLFRLLRRGSLKPFAVYCAAAGIAILIARGFGA
jgi:undecaprenyl-diphosphatase